MRNDRNRRILGWYRLGLRTNPFFHTTLAHRRDPGPGTRLARELLDSSWRVVEVLGHSGAGKTHLARWLYGALEAAGKPCEYQHMEAPRRLPLPGARAQVYFLDEAQRARLGDLHRLGEWLRAGRERRLLMTTHEPVAVHLGAVPTRHEVVDGISDEDLDAYLADRLAEAALPNQTPGLELSDPARTALLKHAQGNFLRLIELLYQACLEPPEGGCLEAPQVQKAAQELPPWQPGELH